MSTEKFANSAQSDLLAPITGVATSLTVVSATSFPTSPQFRLKIEAELVLVTAVAGPVFTITRGIEGTTPAAHAAAVPVTHILTAGVFDQIRYDNVIISPTALAGDQNNWNPTGFSTAEIVRMDSTLGVNVTGLDATAVQPRKTLVNIGVYAIVLPHEDTGSFAANRFKMPSAANVTVLPDAAVRVFYDTTTGRWRLV